MVLPRTCAIQRTKARVAKRLFQQVQAENVVVHAAQLRIAQTSLAKLLDGSGGLVSLEIVERHDLLQMRQVAFIRIRPQVRLQMCEGCDRPAMIEGVHPVGHQYERPASRLQNTVELLERAKWIGNMLQDVRRQQE